MSQHGRSAGLALGLVLMAAACGCEGVPGNFPGGTHASIDKFVYPSTSELPQTVSVVDTRTGQTIWSKDVPVGRQLVIRFYPELGEDSTNPDRMDWTLMQPRMGGATLSNHIFVPPSNARRIETSFRARGEMAPVAAADEPPTASEAPPASAETPPSNDHVPNTEAPTTTPTPEPASAPEPATPEQPPVDIPDGA